VTSVVRAHILNSVTAAQMIYCFNMVTVLAVDPNAMDTAEYCSIGN
jgi:hypothetical protein